MPGDTEPTRSSVEEAFDENARRMRQLADAAAGTTYSSAPPPVRQRVCELVRDTLAVTSWGARRAELAAVRQVVTPGAGTGHATALGTPLAVPSGLAASLNGSAAAADQLQDGHRAARGHPASHVVLAVLPLAEERDASTESLLSAVLAGYEVGARLGRSMHGTPAGVHDIGTWGAVAAAVGTAHLLRPRDPATLARAIELAASAPLLTDAATIFGGHTGGHAYLGASVAHGLWLGQAAAAGLAAAPGALERLFAPLVAADWCGLAAQAPGGWGRWEVLEGYLKLHPACAHLHGVLDALDDVVASWPRASLAEEVQRVRVRTYAAAAAFCAPAAGELQARFSIPTSVALVLRHGRLDDVGTPAVRDLAARVEVTHDAALDAGYPDGRPSVVEVLLRDGRVLSGSSSRPRGDADGNASRDAVRDKAERLLEGAYGQGAGPLLATLREWPDRHTPRELGAAFRDAAWARQEVRR